jgi:PD-(D/E)XK nuclease superfamily
MSIIQISAKNLGAVALPTFCPRCLWFKFHMNKLPWQMFPGIFSSIDSYNKRLVHAWFDDHNVVPPWLASLGEVVGYHKASFHYSHFQALVSTHNIRLTGSPDDVLILRNGSHVIIDYKTAKYTSHADTLYPMYEVQLNVYAFLGDALGLAPIAGLALVYMEPVTTVAAASNTKNHLVDGFGMDFQATVHPVAINVELLDPLLATVRRVFDCADPPVRSVGCKDCRAVDDLVAVAGGESRAATELEAALRGTLLLQFLRRV